LFRKGIILFVVVFFPVLCRGQAREKRALKLIEKHQYHSAYVLLKKALANDSANVVAEYVLAQYYTKPKNQDFELDSAYLHINRALGTFRGLPPREQVRFRRFPLTNEILTRTRDEIETLAFDEAKAVDSEEKYNQFIAFYKESAFQGAAIMRRNAVAFREASKTNSPGAFLTFMQKYPDAQEADAARKKYDHLIFQEGTKDKTLTSYADYLAANPASPYRREVERNIFEIITAEGTPAAFTTFLDQYPNSYFAKRATDLLFHLLPDERREFYNRFFESDSIRRVAEIERTFLVPFLKKGLFGFMNEKGAVVVDPSLPEISEEYLCGNISEDLIVLPGRIIARDGTVIRHDNLKTLDDVGGGFMVAGTDSTSIILHKSGFVFPETAIQDAKLISAQFLAVQKNGLWGLFTLAGRNLLPYECQDISEIEDVIVLQANDRFTLSTATSLSATANNQKGRFTEAFEEVRKIASDKVWIRDKKYEGVLDQKLEILVAMDTHRISPTFFGAVSVSGIRHSTYNEYGEQSEIFRNIQVVNPWVAVRNNSGWMLFDPRQRIAKSIVYDSIAIHGSFAVGIKKESLEIHTHTNPENRIIVPPQDKIEYLPGNDSIAYLLLQKEKKSSVYNNKGVKLFTVTYDRILYAGDGVFIVSAREKKGLINSAGKLLLPIEYDAIGTAANGTVSVLRSMKFGLFDYRTKKLIKPAYEKNLARYNDHVLSVFRNGLWGFVSFENKSLTEIEFQEIVPWTDSLALVKNGDQYQLLNVFTGKPLMENITSYTAIRNHVHDRLFIIRQHEDMGVMRSSDNKFIIPVKFSDIVNVGSADEPVYFTEKHVPEASIFVVIYYDSDGQLIRREVYEQDEYERIYCNQRKQI
jgi:hypothetical protein